MVSLNLSKTVHVTDYQSAGLRDAGSSSPVLQTGSYLFQEESSCRDPSPPLNILGG